MALVLNGSANTIGGLAVGGLPDGIVDTDMVAAEAVTGLKQGPGSVIQYKYAATTDINVRHSESAGTLESTAAHIDITPTHADNLIVVGGWMNVFSDNSNDHYITIHNGSTHSTVYKTYTANLGNGPWIHQNIWYQQTAGTTSELTFTVYHKRPSGSGSVYVGWTSSPGSSFANGQMLWAYEVVA